MKQKMSSTVRIDPEADSGLRARNVVQPSESGALEAKKSARKKKEAEGKETICTIVAKELDPRSIIMWPRMFWLSILRTLQVFASARFITLGDVIAGLVNTALLFTFAAVFSSAIFGEVGLSQYVALGTGCNLITTVIVQGAFTIFSDVGVNVAGPDVNPAIFLATLATIARNSMVANLQAAEEEKHRGDTVAPAASPVKEAGGHRMLSAKEPSFAPTAKVTYDVELNPEALLATVLAGIMITTITFGTFVYVLGRLKVSRGVQLVPGSVLAGFMASIGYLVMLKALKTSMPHEAWDEGPLTWPFWMYFLPAIPIGVAMYLQKRWHIGSPVVLLPIILCIPLAIFFIAVYASGSDIEKARAGGWLFPAFASEKFYNQFADSYGYYNLVDWSALSATVPTMIVMMFIVTVDALLKQAAIRKILKAHDLRIDHELMLLGKANVVTGLLVGVAGYPQPKLVAINYGVVQNTTSRVSGLIILTFHALLFFLGFPLINYLPRFWLAGVLIFAAAGFVVENLWDARLKFSRKEYVSIWAIVIVNALFGMAWAVLAGIMLSALIFAMAYSRGGSIKSLISGSEYRSSVVRPMQDDFKLEHIGTKAVVIQLHRYVFFGSAAYVNEVIVGLIKEQDMAASEEKRAVYFVFDWANVEDVDVTALDVITEMLSKILSSEVPAVGHGHGAAVSHGATPAVQRRTVLFTGLEPRLRKKLAHEKIIQLIHEPEFRGAAGQSVSAAEDAERGISGKHRRCFDTLDRGMEFVEEQLLQWSWEVRKQWFKFDSFRDFHLRARLLQARQSFEQVLAAQLGEDIWKFVEPIQVPKGWSLCRAGDVDSHLYLLREGSLTAYVEQPVADDDEEPKTSRLQTLGAGAFINEDAVYVERSIVPYTVVADVDSVVLALSRENMTKLDYMHPAVAIEVHRKVLRHAARTKHKIVRMLGALNLWDVEHTNHTDSSQVVAINDHTSIGEDNPTVDVADPLAPSLADTNASQQPAVHQSLLGSTFGAIQGVTSTTIGAIQGVTSTTIGAIQGVTSGVTHTTAAALQSGLILTGFREGDDDGKDLLDTTQLRDGAGELSGRRFAQQFTGKRRNREMPQQEGGGFAISEAPSSPRLGATAVVSQELLREIKSVSQFRAVKLGSAADDGDDASSAIFNELHASGQRHSAHRVPQVSLRLSDAQVVNARSAFAKCAGVPLPRAPRGNTPLSQTATANVEMPRQNVREALANIGLTLPNDDPEYGNVNDPIPVTEEDFLRLVTRLSFAELPEEFVQRAVDFFVNLAGDVQGFLTESMLSEALADATVSPSSLARFVQKWSLSSDRGVDVSGFLSALAQHVKVVQLDERIEADWKQISGPEGVVRVDDIARVFGCTHEQAKEMIWEADGEDRGVLSFYDLLDTLTTFREKSNAWLAGGPTVDTTKQ